jgi:hypothetical protein
MNALDLKGLGLDRIDRVIYLPGEPDWLKLTMEYERAHCIAHPNKVKMITSIIAIRVGIILDNMASINLISSHKVTTSDGKVIARVVHNNLSKEEQILVVTPSVDEIFDYHSWISKSNVKDICDKSQSEFLERIAKYK